MDASVVIDRPTNLSTYLLLIAITVIHHHGVRHTAGLIRTGMLLATRWKRQFFRGCLSWLNAIVSHYGGTTVFGDRRSTWSASTSLTSESW